MLNQLNTNLPGSHLSPGHILNGSPMQNLVYLFIGEFIPCQPTATKKIMESGI